MASNWRICGVCDNHQITKTALVWCSECDEALCGDCKKHHSISKGAKDHVTVSIAEYKKLPSEILQNATVCNLHNEKYELFCTRHDCPCCKTCLKSHNDCKGLTDLIELTKNVKTSNAFYEIEQTLVEIVDNIKRLSTNRKENLESLKDKKMKIEAEIKQARTKVNHHLDKLQDELMNELMAVEEEEGSKIQKLLTSLRLKEKEIAEYQANFTNIKQNASKLQAFLVMKHIEKQIPAEEKFIQFLAKSDITDQINISFQISNSLQQITTGVQKFGYINVSFDNYDVSIKKRKNKQAQNMISPPTRNIDNLILTLQKHIDTDMTNVRGCSILPDGMMVFSSYFPNIIRVHSSDGVFILHQFLYLLGDTFDVVFIGDDSIAVTSGGSKKIYIIKVNGYKLWKTLAIDSISDGVAYIDGHLIYCAERKGLQRISLSDESITSVTNNTSSTYAYVTAFGDKLFYTDPANDSVTCCDNHGNIMWTFCNTNILISPCGISVDNDGNLFVVGFHSDNVVVLSSDGQRHRQILSREDGLEYPRVLHYDQSTNTLLVANFDKTALLYDVK